MMAAFASVFAGLAVAGAMACWVAGAVFLSRALDRADKRRGARWLSLAAWPLAFSKLDVATADHAAQANAAKINKALVAFIACLMLAGAATSVATNLHRMAL